MDTSRNSPSDPISLKKVTERIIELADEKETITSEDLPYIVSDVLQKYLGENNIYVSWDYNQFFFIITDIDEGIDNTRDYIQIIESIYEPFNFPPGIFESNKDDHLVFQIIYD